METTRIGGGDVADKNMITHLLYGVLVKGADGSSHMREVQCVHSVAKECMGIDEVHRIETKGIENGLKKEKP